MSLRLPAQGGRVGHEPAAAPAGGEWDVNRQMPPQGESGT